MAYADSIRTTDYTREELATLIDGNRIVGEAPLTSGTQPNYTVTLSPAPAAYFAGMEITVRVHATNTAGPVYIDVNGLGAKLIRVRSLTGSGSRNLYYHEFLLGNTARLVYDGASFVLDNPAGGFHLDTNLAPTTSGTAPNYELTYYPQDIGVPTYGRTIDFICHETLTSGTPTLNVNGTGARNLVVKQYSTVERALLPFELNFGGTYRATYYDGAWQVHNPEYGGGLTSFTPSVAAGAGTATITFDDCVYCWVSPRIVWVSYRLTLSQAGASTSYIKLTLPQNRTGSVDENLLPAYQSGLTGITEYAVRAALRETNYVWIYLNTFANIPIDTSYNLYIMGTYFAP